MLINELMQTNEIDPSRSQKPYFELCPILENQYRKRDKTPKKKKRITQLIFHNNEKKVHAELIPDFSKNRDFTRVTLNLE